MAGKLLTFSVVAMMIAGCDTVPVEASLQLSGPPGPNFDADEAQCRSLASQVGQGHVQTSAVVGGVGGAVIGATESRDDAAIGAVLGTIAGAAVGDAQVKQAQRDYLVQCMQQAGHPVVG